MRFKFFAIPILLGAVAMFVAKYGTKIDTALVMVVRKDIICFLWPNIKNQEVAWKAPSNRLQRNEFNQYDKVVDRANVPNVLLIIADDLGINDLSGGCGVKTPNIDSIRQNGLTFSQAYTGQATCAPSRGALYTGRFATRFGYEFTPVPGPYARIITTPKPDDILQSILHEDLLRDLPSMSDMVLPLNETLISQVLQRNGFDTYFLGKWDSGDHSPYTPIDRGYNESLSFAVGASLFQYPDHSDIVNVRGAMLGDFMLKVLQFYVAHNNGPKMDPDAYMTDYLSKEAAKLIQKRAVDAKKQAEAEAQQDFQADPFFITLAYNAPHNPFQALRSDYEDPEVQLLPTHIERVYAGMLKALDRGVGQVLQALRDSDQFDNTLVIFTSDNGAANYANLPLSNAPYRGWKGTLFEGGIRVPLLMQWPRGIKKLRKSSGGATESDDANNTEVGFTVNDHVALVDIFPTLAGLVSSGVEDMDPTKSLNGINLLSLFRAKADDDADDDDEDNNEQGGDEVDEEDTVRAITQHALSNRPLFWRSGHYSATRKGDWKLQIALRPNKVWLFNLKDDPTEKYNLAAQIGITTQETLFNLVNGTASPTSDPSEIYLREQLLHMYDVLLELQRQQGTPNWNSVAETPILVDKVRVAKQMPGDEYVYWSN